MRQYEFEKTSHNHSVWNSPSKEPPKRERNLPSAPANAKSSLLQLQRQQGNQYVQRFLQLARSAESDGDMMPNVERAIESSRGGGQSLDRGVQAQMGTALNADLSGVRVHTDAGADGLNQSLSARAFTTGRDIYFREGEYNPGSSQGRELLAHELTHVVQQNPDQVQTKTDEEGVQPSCACGGAASGPQMKLSVSQPGDQYEQEADRVANAVMHQESSGSAQTQSINRQMPEDEEEKLQGKYRDDKIRRQMEEEEEKPT